jgi:hypothetical protein
MTADVNGFGWGFATALLDAGVENLFTCVHTHHGMYPLGRTQVPFWWEDPDGRRLLVWSGEHYHLGNELGIVPGAVSSYTIKDECDTAMIFGDHRAVAEIRIPRYVQALKERGYAYDFAPVMASGLRTDNAPPSARILDAIEWWNESHDDGIRLEMATLDDVFQRVRARAPMLPVYRGDWPDWWSDGPASRPADVRLFRRAQRDLARLRALEAYGEAAPVDTTAIESDLALFAEHTFSHSDAMSTPWYPLVHEIDAANTAHASRAAASVGAALDGVRERLGGGPLAIGAPLRWRVLNPTAAPVRDAVGLGVGHHEFEELGLGGGFEVRDLEDGSALAAELALVPRGGEILVPLDLGPAQERTLEVVPVANGRTAPETTTAPGELVTDALRIVFGEPHGIVRFEDRRTGRDLLRPDRPYGPFQCVHDVTPVADRSDICAVRGRMDLNRKGEEAIVSDAVFTGEATARRGEVLDAVTLTYDLPGTRLLEVEVRAHEHAPRVDVAVRMHKESLWAPENLYVALPFRAGPEAVTWLDKAGCRVRPPEEQIPGTLTDFYAVQAGFASVEEDALGVVVLMPDQHLLQLGPLEHRERLLAGDERLADDPRHAYGWLMTNYWETNFSADLGGFYEFRYTVLWGEELARPEEALARGRAAIQGLEAIRLAGSRA